MSGLLLALNQESASVPYTFKITGINVYSFEEALYHCYVYWKESLDDFTCHEFINWVRDELGHAYISSKIKAISEIDGFTEKFLQFLFITDYFDNEQIVEIKNNLKAWENSLEWERLKERADSLSARGDAVKAYPLYKRALSYGENAELINNFAICMLKLQKYEEAYELFNRAYEADPDNIDILLNFTESAIYSRNFNKAVALLHKASESESKDESYIYYLYGELNFETGDIRNAASYFEKAINENCDSYYVYRLSEIYVELRMYDKAMEALERIKYTDKDFLMKQAEVYIASGHIPAAIKSIEKALLSNKSDPELWIRLAVYHRLNYDHIKAQAAIVTALNIDPYNEKALLENARIKKSQGKTKDYQEILKNILNSFKKKYREPAR